MSGKANISIPKPCHENWYGMTVAEKDRFCNSCQKAVYDFTQLSDRQLLEKINSEANVCGRFLTSQLNKDLRMPKEKSSIWIAGISGILSFLSLGNQEVYAQENIKIEQTQGKGNVERMTTDSPSIPEIEIFGYVYDQDGLPIPDVLLSINGKPISAQTDLDAKFSIKARKGDSLGFHHISHKEIFVIVDSKKSKKPIIVKLETTEPMLIGEVVYRRTFFGRIFHSIGNLFR